MSVEQYAQHRGVTSRAVYAAIREGRLERLAGGLLDVEDCDARWFALRKGLPGPGRPVDPAPKDVHEPTSKLFQVKLGLERERLRERTLRRKKLQRALVERAPFERRIFELVRAERDAWQRWPARVCGGMAGQLGVEPAALQRLLDRAVIAHLAELADLPKHHRSADDDQGDGDQGDEGASGVA